MLTLAWRNIWRNFRRSLITTASMGFGLTAIMFGQSMIKSEQAQLIEKATGSITGHIQVQHRNTKEYKFPDKLIDRGAPVSAALQKLQDKGDIVAFQKRINITGLISTPAGSVGAFIGGVEPEKDKKITTMSSYLVKGEFLNGPKTIVLGDKLAQRLDVRMGEKVVVMAQAEDGSMGAEALRVCGIFHTGSTSFDGQIVYVPLPIFQELLAAGDRANHFVARVANLDQVDAVKAELAELLASERDVQVLSWKDVDHEILSIQQFQDGMLGIVLLVVFAIVALGILNTLLMSLFERVREFGVLMAIGARPRWVMKLVLLESVLLGAIGTLMGLAMGSAMILYYGKFGLRLPIGDALSYFLPFPSVIYLRFVWANHAFAAGCVLVTSVLAAIAPSLRACRLKPAEALRHV